MSQMGVRRAKAALSSGCKPHPATIQMEGYGGPAQPSPTIGQCLNGGLGWLEIECKRCKTRASIPLEAIRRPRDTLIWKLEASLKCRSCRKGRYAPPVRMIRLTERQEIAPTLGCTRTRIVDRKWPSPEPIGAGARLREGPTRHARR